MVILICVFLLAQVSGCSTNRTQQDYFSVFYDAYAQLTQRHNVSKEQASSLPYAVMQVSLNDARPILMPMGFIHRDQQKWYSKDRFSFTTQSARITQIYKTDTEVSGVRIGALWQRFNVASVAYNQQIKMPIDLDFLTLKRFSVKGVITLKGVSFEERLLWGERVKLLRIEEELSIPSMKYRYTNVYWKDTKTQFIWESIQKWGADLPEIHYKVVKPWKTVAYP